MSDVERLLDGRKLVDDYRAVHSSTGEHEVDKLISGLKEIGFASISEFFSYNEKRCIQQRMRCYKVVVPCDGCQSRKRGCYPDCIEKRDKHYSPSTKTINPSNTQRKDDIGRRIADGTMTLEELKANHNDFHLWRNFPNNVPPGCVSRYGKVAEPEFDIFWEMPLGITPEKYEQDKKSWK